MLLIQSTQRTIPIDSPVHPLCDVTQAKSARHEFGRVASKILIPSSRKNALIPDCLPLCSSAVPEPLYCQRRNETHASAREYRAKS
jgi:hypothetical protein